MTVVALAVVVMELRTFCSMALSLHKLPISLSLVRAACEAAESSYVAAAALDSELNSASALSAVTGVFAAAVRILVEISFICACKAAGTLHALPPQPELHLQMNLEVVPTAQTPCPQQALAGISEVVHGPSKLSSRDCRFRQVLAPEAEAITVDAAEARSLAEVVPADSFSAMADFEMSKLAF